jgi:hypothetical protein
MPQSDMKDNEAKTPFFGSLVVTLFGLTPLFGMEQQKNHDPVEYYRTFTGYDLPLRLRGRMTREEAESSAAAGFAYYIASYSPEGTLTKVVKMFRGAMLYEQSYEYDANRRLKRVTTRHADARVDVRDY